MKSILIVVCACLFSAAHGEDTAAIAARIKAREAQRQSGVFSQYTKTGTGHVKFDHTKNNGKFVISDEKKTFTTSWSGCITGKIWAYREENGLIGYKEGYGQFPSAASEFEGVMDFSNRAVAVNVGDVALFVNAKGDFLVIRLLAVKYVDRGDDEYCVEFDYKIY